MNPFIVRKPRSLARPESEEALKELTNELLRAAGAEGLLPTPIERLLEVAKVKDFSALPAEWTLSSYAQKIASKMMQLPEKVRGIADLRMRAVYAAPDRYIARRRFAKGHELAHQIIPWHRDAAYIDTAECLSPVAKDFFEREANFVSADIMFQGDRFQRLARSYQPTFDAIFSLADLHAASRQCTAWKFIEEQDEVVALAQYYPGHSLDEFGQPTFRLWGVASSPSFERKFRPLHFPQLLQPGHIWAQSRDVDFQADGNDFLLFDGQRARFQWQSWWNGYALLVLVRHKPLLSIVGSTVRIFGRSY